MNSLMFWIVSEALIYTWLLFLCTSIIWKGVASFNLISSIFLESIFLNTSECICSITYCELMQLAWRYFWDELLWCKVITSRLSYSCSLPFFLLQFSNLDICNLKKYLYYYYNKFQN
jgi:hypothetical protein